ncbi:MAG: recombination mediator RecR [Candidatus Ornithomonoglobus sp.]
MLMYSAVIDELIEKFERLPGIGHKSAERIAFYILEQMSGEDAEQMAGSIVKAKKSIRLCERCQNLTDESPCSICSSPKRDKSIICVVEGPEDVSAIENTHEYNGLYHVLHGALSPMDGIGPDDIKINELLLRLTEGGVQEIILATNPTVNGTATAVYISKLLAPFDVKVTRIAHGIPIGSDIEYADKITIIKAMESRQEMK